MVVSRLSHAVASALLAASSDSCPTASRPDVAARIRGQYGALGGWPTPEKLPIVYHPAYNIGFLGLEKLHPFDSKKYGKVGGPKVGSPFCEPGVSSTEAHFVHSGKQAHPGPKTNPSWSLSGLHCRWSAC